MNIPNKITITRIIMMPIFIALFLLDFPYSKFIALGIFILAAAAMVSCAKTYNAQTVELINQNDSMNYALGLVNGSQLKMYQLRNDSSMETVVEFIDA